VAALGGFLFGYDTAVVSGTVGFLRSYFSLTPAMLGWAVSCALVGCVLGVSIAGILSDKFGRKMFYYYQQYYFLYQQLEQLFLKHLNNS